RFYKHSCLKVDAIGPAVRRVAAEVFAVDLIHLGDIPDNFLQIETYRDNGRAIDTGLLQQLVILAKNLTHLGSGPAEDRRIAAGRNASKHCLHGASRVDDGCAERKRRACTK